jgi:hypothetical protein
MASRDLVVVPIPGANREKYAHSNIFLLATEDAAVLNLFDSDDAEKTARVAREHFPDRNILVFADQDVSISGCTVISELPIWARRWRLEFAIEEGEADWLRSLPMGTGRDLFFQGLGAMHKWKELVAAKGTSLAVRVSGTFESDSIDSDARLSLVEMQPMRMRAELTDRRARTSSGTRQFELELIEEPDYLIPLFEQAFDLPAVPRLHRVDASREQDLITGEDLAVLGMATGVIALTPQHPKRAHVRLQAARYDLQAHAHSD